MYLFLTSTQSLHEFISSFLCFTEDGHMQQLERFLISAGRGRRPKLSPVPLTNKLLGNRASSATPGSLQHQRWAWETVPDIQNKCQSESSSSSRDSVPQDHLGNQVAASQGDRHLPDPGKSSPCLLRRGSADAPSNQCSQTPSCAARASHIRLRIL